MAGCHEAARRVRRAGGGRGSGEEGTSGALGGTMRAGGTGRLQGRGQGPGVTAIRVVIADDQRVSATADAARRAARRRRGGRSAADGVEAVELARRERPDVVLMDLRMPNLDGAAATRRIRGELPGTEVPILDHVRQRPLPLPGARGRRARLLTKDAGARRSNARSEPSHEGRTHLEAAIQGAARGGGARGAAPGRPSPRPDPTGSRRGRPRCSG